MKRVNMRESKGYRVAVVGATGAVGREMLATIAELDFPISQLIPLASSRSAGKELEFRGSKVVVKELQVDSFDGVDLALFSAGGARSREFAPVAKKAGCVVIDNSSAWRMHDDVPLVVPEVNAEALVAHQGIIANPNCSTIQMVLALKAIKDHVALERVVVSTYQSAAGAGQAGIDELRTGSTAALAGSPLPSTVFSRALAFDCIPQIGSFEASGYTNEEEKMLFETRKILGLPELPVSATCVRVPVERGHLESITVDVAESVSVDELRGWMEDFPGLVVMDDPTTMLFPVARDCVGSPETFIGRIRKDGVLAQTLHFWCVSDNLLKGAAWNAVQIAQNLHEQGLICVR